METIDASLSVPSARSALAELAARPIHPERAKTFAAFSSEVAVDAQAAAAPGSARFGSPAHQAAAAEMGLVRLGVALDRSFGREMRKEMWATRDGVASVSLTNPDRYVISTYFDDGSAHLTWAHPEPRTKSQPGLLLSSGGTGDLRADVAAHVARVKVELDRGRRFFKVDDIETTNELNRHYYRQVVPVTLLAINEQARLANKRPPYLLGLVAIGIVAAVVMYLVR
jgi:hypothetical protein